MLAATTSPWYLPTCVSGQSPVTPPIAAQLAAVVELEDVVVAVAARRRGVGRQHDLDAVAAQHLAEGVAEGRRLAREQMPGPVDDRHLSAQAAHRLGHLDADR